MAGYGSVIIGSVPLYKKHTVRGNSIRWIVLLRDMNQHDGRIK